MFWELYVGPDSAPEYADLLAGGSLRDLPSTPIFTAGLDPLRDEGEDYADQLGQAGVAVTLTRVYGLLHGSWGMEATGDRAYQFGLDVAGALRRASARRPQH
jgi:acetyl esterase